MGSEVRVRFAPSPTGYLHIGGARTALFNWVYARARGGKFILRIEDTDRERSRPEFVEEILDSLKWLGMNWDEGPFFQSQREEIYKEFAEKLLREGKAYRARERRNKGLSYKPQGEGREVDEDKGEAIIFAAPEKEVSFVDLIRGPISVDSRQFGDIVLIKSDGLPAYNFACVVDDALMGITHILRGEDHISNTPKQILLYEALGFPVPEFAHLPLIMGKDGGRLSKRTGATAVSEYRKMGYLPEAIVNYLMLLGWSIGPDREIFSLEEAIKVFDVKDVNKTSAVFDFDKLRWMNSEYIKAKSSEELLSLLEPFLQERGLSPDRDYALRVIDLFKTRASTLIDFVEWGDYFWREDYTFEDKAVEMHLVKDMSGEFTALIEVFRDLEDWSVESIERDFRELVDRLGLKPRDLIHPVRVAVSGKKVGPGLFELLYVLGKETVIRRLQRQIERWRKGEDA